MWRNVVRPYATDEAHCLRPKKLVDDFDGNWKAWTDASGRTFVIADKVSVAIINWREECMTMMLDDVDDTLDLSTLDVEALFACNNAVWQI